MSRIASSTALAKLCVFSLGQSDRACGALAESTVLGIMNHLQSFLGSARVEALVEVVGSADYPAPDLAIVLVPNNFEEHKMKAEKERLAEEKRQAKGEKKEEVCR